MVNFNDEYYLDQDFTNDLLKLKEALEKIDARGGTALYDALVASGEHLKRFARLEKKVLFVVTDGEDNASNETLEQAVKHSAGRERPSVYAIGILGDEEHPKRARRALEIIAHAPAGLHFFPRRWMKWMRSADGGARHPESVHDWLPSDESQGERRLSADSRRRRGQGPRQN